MRSEISDQLFSGGGELGSLMRSLDWSRTPLGPAEDWPQSLRTSVSICLNSAFAILVWWGPELVALYNDAYAPVIAKKHPWALGKPGKAIFPEVWGTIGPMLDRVMHEGEAVRADDLLLFLERDGYPEECYFTFSYSPILGEHGGVGGVFTPVQETTERVIGERRLTTLGRLAELRASKAATPTAACRAMTAGLGEDLTDLPFVAMYLLGPEPEAQPELVATVGSVLGDLAAPEPGAMGMTFLDAVLRGESSAFPVSALTDALPLSPWGKPVEQCIALPFGQPGAARPRGLILVGINPHKRLDEAYESFLALVADHIGGAVAEAEAAEQERKRMEALAEIDRAKTTFFSNISHEFRTPLTLIMGPLQALLGSNAVPEDARESLVVAQRNSLRLHKLVNNLLDFSRIEAGRMQAYVQPTQIGELTEDLVSGFRSAYERAGLFLEILLPRKRIPSVLVDRDMWEKIVLNLLSNALKFTLSGGVRVELRANEDTLVLAVQDTGIGIPQTELSRIFERFHRVEGAQGRSYEGTGIGLALVQELVKLHGGGIVVESEPGNGSRFTVTMPLLHASNGAVDRSGPAPQSTGMARPARLETFVSEALRWSPEVRSENTETSALHEFASTMLPALPPKPDAGPYRVLVADDNADMRQYIARLLQDQLQVELASDGQEALACIRRHRPDLLVTDIMMPVLDGLSLLAGIRSDPGTATLPVILMSAKAGQEAEMEGLRSGADDYIVKPFSGPELVTRVQSLLKISAVRTAAEQALRLSEERLRLALDSAAIGTWDFDPVSGMLDWDERTKAAFGMAPDAAVDYPGFLHAIHPDDRERTDAAVQAALDPEGKGSYDIEYRTVGVQDGITRWVIAKGSAIFDDVENRRRPIRFIGTVVNVTSRKLTELALRDSEVRAQKILEQTTDAVFMLSTDWRFTYLNANAVRYIAAGRDLLGKNVWEEFPDAVDREFARQYRRAMQERVPVQFEEYYPEPLNKWFEVHAYPTEEGLAVFFDDVTSRRRSEAALLQTEKIAAAGRLAASISHEINNPLESVTNLLYLIGHDSRLSPETREYVEIAQTELGRVSQITTQTLRFYRQSTRATETNLEEILRSIVDFYTPKLRAAHITVDFRHRSSQRLIAFGGELRQVFANLIGNAIDAIASDGRILIRTHHAHEPLGRREGVRVVIADTGSGMDAATMARIFEPFFTTKGVTGTGLGLWISKEIIEKHHGNIRVRSSMHASRQGTVFSIFIPYRAAGSDGRVA